MAPQATRLEHRGRSRYTAQPASIPLRSWIRKIQRRCTIRSKFLSVIMVTLQDKPFLIYIYLTSPSVWWALAWRWGWMFRGTVKRWWKGKECFVYPLQSLTLKLNVPIKFITTALLSLRCTLGWREPGSGGAGRWAEESCVYLKARLNIFVQANPSWQRDGPFSSETQIVLTPHICARGSAKAARLKIY